MFCMNCGTKLPDNAKFCYQCGEKTNVGGEQNSVQEVKSSAPVTDSEKKTAEKNNVTTENKEQNSPKDKNTALNNNGKTKNSKNSEETIEPGGMDFYVLGRKVHVDERTVQTDMIQRKYVALAYEKSNKARKEFIDSFEQVTDLNSIRRLFIDTVEANCHEAIDLAYDEFIKDKLFHIKKDSFDKMLYRRIDESAGMQSIQKGIGNIAAMKSQLAYEKEANKANWVGGGFGISGAIKGAVQAKALNMAQDGLTSLAKSVTGNSDSAKLRRYAEAQVGSVNTYAESVAQVVYQFIRTYLPEDIVYEKNKIRQKNGLRGYNNLLRTTKETVNWCRNIVELFKSERITQDEAIDELCKSLGSRTDRIELYRGILEVDINAYEGLSDIARFDGYEHLLAQDYFRINKERLQKALAPYIGEKAYKYTWIRQAATDLDLKPIITNLKLNSLNETQEIDSKKQITIQLINNTFHIDPEAIHNELASSNIELIFEGLGDNARVIVKSDEPLPKKYGNFITFENVKLDKDYLNLLKSASSELKTLSEEAIKAGDVDKAIEYLKQMLQMNDDEAAFKIAKLYLNEKHDWENALAYFEQCPNDNVEALVLMAEIQKEKLGNKKKYEQLLNRAAEIYLAEAGKANKKNDRAGVLNNLDKAVKCNSGEAYCRYGTLYEKGKYVERDIQKAIEYYKKGIELNNKNAQIRLSYCYLNIGSEYEKTDIDKAVEYYKMSIELENSDAHEKLVDLYLKLGSKCEKTDVQKAIEYYKKGIELESSEAKNKLANLYLDLGSECEKTDTQKAIEYYKEAIDLGNLKAHKKFADLYLNLGSECEKTDVQQAIEYYKLAFEMDNEKAAIKLGDLYSNKSLPAIYNYSSAMTWYKLVESSEEGRKAIQKLKENGKLAERLSFFITFYAPKFEGTYYYFYPSVSKDAFKNAAKSYANHFSIAYNDALVLYDSTHSMFFGKGKAGFIITSDGYLVTSQMSMIALKDVEKLSSVSKGKVIALPSKETVFESKKLDKSDVKFMEALNNEVLGEKAPEDNAPVTSLNSDSKVEARLNVNNEKIDYYTEGNKYLHGIGVLTDPQKALKWFEKGAVNGDKLCQYNLGYIYSSNLLGAPDYEKCKYWFTKAADNGVVEAKQYLENNKDFFATIGKNSSAGNYANESFNNGTVDNSISTMTPATKRNISEQDFNSLRYAFNQLFIETKKGTFMVLDLISAKKAKNVVDSYAKNLGIKVEDIRVLVDTTVFGSAKEGLILTNQYLMGSNMNKALPLNSIQYLNIENDENNNQQHVFAEPMHQHVTSFLADDEARVFFDKVNQCIFKAVVKPVDEQNFIKLKESFGQPFWKKFNDEFGVLDLIPSKRKQKVCKAVKQFNNMVFDYEKDVKVLIYESNFTTNDEWIVLTNMYIRGSSTNEIIPLNQIKFLKLESSLGKYKVYAEPMHTQIAEIDEKPQFNSIIDKINTFIFGNSPA